jgi:DUF917 family protein
MSTARRSLSETDLEDIVNGACLFGAGGGGPWKLGMSLVAQIVAAGKDVVLADPGAMPAAATTCVSAGVGSPAAASSAFPLDAAAHAFDALGAMQPEPFTYVLPAELGAANSIIPMTVAALRGLPVLDAAGSPRAVPALEQSTFASRGAPIGTVVLANALQRVFFDGHDPSSADATMRGIISSGAFTEDAGAALWAMHGTTVQAVAVSGTTELARSLGATLRDAVAAGQDPVTAVCGFLGGRVLQRGRILPGSGDQTSGGFDTGVVTVGDGQRSLRIVNQNENMVAWTSAQPHPVALAPDLICFLTTDGQPFSNADLELAEGKEVAVIGAPVGGSMRDARIIEAFMPVLRQAGYGGPYVPIEELWDR